MIELLFNRIIKWHGFLVNNAVLCYIIYHQDFHNMEDTKAGEGI